MFTEKTRRDLYAGEMNLETVLEDTEEVRGQ